MKHKKFCLVFLIGLMILYLSGCSDSAVSNQSQTGGNPTYPITSDVFTTRQRTIVLGSGPFGPDTIFPYEISKFKQNGYGTWSYGAGIDAGKQLDIMPAGYNSASVTNTAKLLHFFTMTDMHLVDKESPAQSIFAGYKGSNSASYSPVMLYTTHVLDAAVQTVNAIHKQIPFDYGLFLGDATNNTQYNELRWYIDVLDGKLITPGSGNHAGADTIDYQKPYKAAGLDKTIPWCQVPGNHDQFWQGAFPMSDSLRQACIGENILAFGLIPDNPIEYVGAIDGRTPYGDIMGVGPVGNFSTPPKVFAADPNRRSLSRQEWMSEFFNTSSNPAGHGFNQTNINNNFSCYSFEPKSNIPLRIIMLDDLENANSSTLPTAQGFLDQARYDWLISELDKGQSEGKLMIIAAHAPIGVAPSSSPVGWSTSSYISDTELINILHKYPNFILWLAGHRHYNAVTSFKSQDNTHPEQGFWEIETSSLRDFPQQFRTFDIIRNSDNTISIITTDVDPAVREGSPASISRFYGAAAQQLFLNPVPYMPVGSFNGEFVKQLSPEMQAKIQNYGTPIGR